MNTFVKLQRKGQMTIPSPLREALGVKEGDMIEVSLQRGKVVLTPKQVVSRDGRQYSVRHSGEKKGRRSRSHVKNGRRSKR